MSKKSHGYVELYWTCPNCSNENRGSVRVCATCGSPQPDNVEFHQAARQELITDEEKLAQAKAGADIHCAYCGTRNPATATHCSQCKAELSEGVQRKAGRVVGAFKTGPAETVTCPHCGTKNPDVNLTCANCGGRLGTPQPSEQAAAEPAAKPQAKGKLPAALIAIPMVLCALAAVFLFLSNKTKTLTGTVTAVQWERSIPIEAFGPVEHQDWLAELPADAEVGSCQLEVYSVESEPVPGAEEVCGTPYTVDKGSGFGEVVQDCEYHVYEDYCSYTVNEWQVVETAVLEGNDLNPVWPQPSLSSDERLGDEREESFACIFEANGESYTYTTEDSSLFQQCQIGSTWELEVNTFGNVAGISQ